MATRKAKNLPRLYAVTPNSRFIGRSVFIKMLVTAAKRIAAALIP